MPSFVLLVSIFNPSDPALQFWVSAISLILAVAGIPTIASIVLSIRNKPKKRLSYETISDVGLVNQQKDLGAGITVILKGGAIGEAIEVNDARIVMLKLINTGSEAIHKTDFNYDEEDKIRFDFTEPKLIFCAVHDTEPEELIPPHKWQSVIHLDTDETATNSTLTTQVQTGAQSSTNTQPFHRYVDLDGRSLNPNNAITLKFVTRGRVPMQIKGQLMEGSIVAYIPPAQVVTPRRVLITLAALSLLVGLVISNSIGLMGAFLQGNCALSLSPVNISGSSAFYTTAQSQAKTYRETCPVATLNVSSSDSAAGLTQLEAKNLDIANSELTPKEANFAYNDLIEHQVAAIIFTLIVNKDVTGINSLTQDQITAIYNGTISNWKQINGPDLPIVLFGRPSGSGTQAAFTHFVLNRPETAIQNPVSSTQEVINGVGTTPGAIGYADLGSANSATTTVTLLEIGGNAPTLGLVTSGHYPFWAIERMYTRRDSNALSLSFINYVINTLRTSDTFIPIASLSPAIVITHG